MYHPILFKYAQLYEKRFTPRDYHLSEHLEKTKKTIEESFKHPHLIDDVNWWTLAEVITTHLGENLFSEDTFSDVLENEDWDWSEETLRLAEVLREVVKTVDMSHKKLEDWL